MKAIIILLFILSPNLAFLNDPHCKLELIQFYGLTGPDHSDEPIHYPSIRSELGFDACPGMEYSCCTISDFKLTKTKWDAKADNIKRYLTKLFRIIQKTTVLQSSLLEMTNVVSSRPNKFCKEINSTFFQKAIQYDEIYFYLQNSLNAFAFMQKGFYCAICDSKNHDYLALKDERNPDSRVAVIDVKFCNDLIYFFKEFIMFKIFYIDPMIINTNFLFNCYEDTDKYRFDFNYKTTYHTIERCVDKGEGCEYICKEFRLGTASDLFIGKLEDYHTFFNNLERIVTKFNPTLRRDLDNEIVVDDELYPDEFFANDDSDMNQDDLARLKEYDASTFTIRIEEKGINMFDISSNSNYYLSTVNNNSQIKSHLASISTAAGTDEYTSMTSNDAEDLRKEAEWEEQHQAEKMEQDPNKPTSAELSSLIFQRDNLETDFLDNVKTRGNVEYEAGTNNSNFSSVGTVKQASEESAWLIRSMMVGLIFVMFW